MATQRVKRGDFRTGVVFEVPKRVRTPEELNLNPSLQPWQKHAKKLAKRAELYNHPLSRRIARDARKAANLAASGEVS